MDPTRIGRYEVTELLGQGGMGRVYLATDTVLGRRVALKLVRDDLGLPPEVRRSLFERMRNEAKAAAALTHPNVVTLHDMGDDDEFGLFLVFAYVEGPTLRERLENGPLAPIEVSKIALELGGALTHAHQNGVIHRDVKPENVILSPAGAVLTDFGIARIPDSTLTMPQTMIGTAAYSAPETRGGKRSSSPPPAEGEGTPANERFGPAADQFSLAATLYEALAGARAFPGEDIVAVVEAVQKGDPILLADTTQDERLRIVLGRADGVVRRALSPSPEERYASCRAFADALASALDARVSGAFTIPPPQRTSIVPRATRRWQNILLGLALIVIVGLWAFGRRATSGDDHPVPSATLVSAPPKPSTKPTAPKATATGSTASSAAASAGATSPPGSALPPLPPP